MLTLDDAVDLVLYAVKNSKGGEIFVLDMGKPVRLVDMARNLIRAAGFVPDQDIAIKFIGLRPGEKLHETLATAEEIQKSRDLGEALRIPMNPTDLIDPNPELARAYTQPDYTSENTRRLSLPEVVSLLASLPELQRELALV